MVQSFNNLGGVATYSQLYAEIERIRDEEFSNSWKAVVRACIERNSSDSTVFDGKNDIFYSVEGIGNGIWGLRNLTDAKYNIANDISYGVNESQETYRREVSLKRVVRDTKIIRELKALHNNTCQLCGTKLQFENGVGYSEGHHIKPLGSPHNGPDIKENIIILCPNCHAMCDFGAIELNKKHVLDTSKHNIAEEYIDYHNELRKNK